MKMNIIAHFCNVIYAYIVVGLQPSRNELNESKVQ